jgi:hypothetical protein
MVCETIKDFHFSAAGLKKPQGTLRQLRGVLQAAQCVPLPEKFRKRQRLLLCVSASPVELQKISANKVGINHRTDVRL